MDVQKGWLERSLEQAHRNIQARPDHLKPARYRDSKTTSDRAAKSSRQTRKKTG